jgi:hypothetical protein
VKVDKRHASRKVRDPISNMILKAAGLVRLAAMLVHRFDIALNDRCKRLILAAV